MFVRKNEVRLFSLVALPLVAMVAFTLITLACASLRHNAVTASGAVYSALAAVQDTEATLHTGGQVTDAQHKAFAAKMGVALEAGQAFNAAVASWPKGGPMPPTLKQTADSVFTAANAALQVLPLGPAKDALVARVLAVAQAVTDVLLTQGSK